MRAAEEKSCLARTSTTSALHPPSWPQWKTQVLATPEHPHRAPTKWPTHGKSTGRWRPERPATWPGEEAKPAVKACCARGLPSPDYAACGQEDLSKSSPTPEDQGRPGGPRILGPLPAPLDGSLSVRRSRVFIGSLPGGSLLGRYATLLSRLGLACPTEQTRLEDDINTRTRRMAASKIGGAL